MPGAANDRDALKTAQGFVFGYNASGVDLRENPGRPDIAIMNSIGFDATCIGNHEFDLGTSEFANIVLPLPQTTRTNMRHYGAAFPFLSANLDFSADTTLNARYTSAIRNTGAFAPHPNENYPGLSASPTNAKLAKSAIIERGGEISRDPGDHAVGMTERDHRCAEHVAILVHQALHVAIEQAVAL